MKKSTKMAAAALAVLSLVACGGGGGKKKATTNAPPTMAAQSFAGTEDQTLNGQLAASDPGDTLSFSVANPPANGNLTVTAGGAFTFVPQANFSGNTSFTARVADSRGQSTTATITLAMANVPDPPVAVDDSFRMSPNNLLGGDVFDVLDNDVDPDPGAPIVSILGTPPIGQFSVLQGEVIFTPPAGFSGVTHFDYNITNAAGLSAQARAVVFTRMDRFKIVYLGEPVGGGARGIYVNDLLTNTRVTPADAESATATIESIRVARDGDAVVYQRNDATAGRQLFYVSLDTPGVARLVGQPGPGESFDDFIISDDGRFVVYQLRLAANGDRLELWSFDATQTTGAARVSLPEHYSAFAPTFNDTGRALFYTGIAGEFGPSAIYRAQLEARTVARVSLEIPVNGGKHHLNWITINNSRLLSLRSNASASLELWVNDVGENSPDFRLHEALGVNERVNMPIVSPDMGHAIVQVLDGNDAPLRLRLADTANPGTTQPIGSDAFQLASVHEWGYRDTAARADSQAALVISDNEVYEVSFNAPSTPARVSASSLLGGTVVNPQYGRHGDRVVWHRLNGNLLHVLESAQRSFFGVVSAPFTPIDERVSVAAFDSEARVAAVSYAGSPALYLINVEAPGVRLPVGQATFNGGVFLVPR